MGLEEPRQAGCRLAEDGSQDQRQQRAQTVAGAARADVLDLSAYATKMGRSLVPAYYGASTTPGCGLCFPSYEKSTISPVATTLATARFRGFLSPCRYSASASFSR